jgi:hypothetical protein
MPNENGNPLPGEWWGDNSGPAFYMISHNTHGQMVYEVRSGENSYIENDSTNYWADAVHLPDCTGWDWQAPEWVELDPENYGWHVLRADLDWCIHCTREDWKPVSYYCITGRTIEEKKGNWQFRCLRKDLPKPPEPAVTAGGPYVSIEVHQKVVAERDALLSRMREIEAKAKFYESVM